MTVTAERRQWKIERAVEQGATEQAGATDQAGGDGSCRGKTEQANPGWHGVDAPGDEARGRIVANDDEQGHAQHQHLYGHSGGHSV